MITADLNVVLPELILAVYAMGALMFAVYTGKDATAPLILGSTAALMAALGVWIAISGSGEATAFGGAFIDDGFSRFAKVIILLSAAAILLMSQSYMERIGILKFEYPSLLRWRRSA